MARRKKKKPNSRGRKAAVIVLISMFGAILLATCWAALNEEPPGAGTLTVVTDWSGEAGCVIETVRAQVMRFGDMTWALAQKEGEDECLRSWRENHIRFFSEESAREGYSFSEEMEIIFEEFRVVWPEELADEK